MYLTDAELIEKFDELALTSDDDVQFDPASQVGPCSIDLRWSRVYWVTTRRNVFPASAGTNAALDLGKTALREYDTSRGWRRVELMEGDSLNLKPGETVLARTAEKFTIPPDCAGAVEGRSSFARLGISVHANAGFINPGWRGHMPLTITNHSNRTIKLPVGVAICQLMLVRLGSRPTRAYADRVGQAKYMDDYGGPSYWWRDDFFQQIVSKGPRIDERVFDDLDQLFSNDNPEFEVLERLETFVATRPGLIDNTDALLGDFAKSEDRKYVRTRITLASMRSAIPVVAVGLLYPLFLMDVGTGTRIFIAILVLLCAAVSAWAFTLRSAGYLTTVRLDRARLTQGRRASQVAQVHAQGESPGGH